MYDILPTLFKIWGLNSGRTNTSLLDLLKFILAKCFSLMQVDLFFYREPEEAKQQEEEEAPAGDYAITDFNAGAIAADGQWPGTIDQSWSDAVPQPIPAAPGVNWGAPAEAPAGM